MDENLLKHRLLSNMLPDIKAAKIIMVTGARQTGKTTLCRDKYSKLKYVNLDAYENREFINSVSSFNWKSEIGNAVIDEAQKTPGIFDKLKFAFDEKKISFTVLLGSSQILMLKNIRESLAGRVSIFELFPLMMTELNDSRKNHKPLIHSILSAKDIKTVLEKEPAALMPEKDADYISAEKYLLKWGGMPALLHLSEKERWKWLKDYEYTYLERDLIDLVRLNDLEPFAKFKKLTALRSGKLLNYSDLARDAGISVDTARRYLEYLKISYQTLLLQPYHTNVTSSVVKTPKVYWLDICLLRSISGQREETTGDIYETMVVSELYKYIKTMQLNNELYFYRTRSGLEIDAIAESENGIIGFEVKSRDTTNKSDATKLIEFAQALKQKKWRGGIIVYSGNRIEKVAEPNIWAVPARRLFG
ncbi:MAG TPA: ATP-binding protein [bacterium]|nr:ATP-binding protein [bacterium]